MSNDWDLDFTSNARGRESSEDLYGDLPDLTSGSKPSAPSSKIGSATYSRYSGRKQSDDDLYNLQGSYFQTAFSDAYENQNQVSIKNLPVKDPYEDLYGGSNTDYLNADAYMDVFSNKNRKSARPESGAKSTYQRSEIQAADALDKDLQVPTFVNRKPAEKAETAPAPETVEAKQPAAQQPQRTPASSDARPVQPVSQQNRRMGRRGESRPLKRPERPVAPIDFDGVTDDELERLERMRRAGTQALEEKGFEPEEAEAFMNTGRLNLKDGQQELNEQGVDKAFSAQQTARMAVIKQAQQDARLEQPQRAARANHSRPGYATDGAKTKSRSGFWKTLLEWVVMIVLAAGIAFLLRSYIISFYKVDGPSMQPTLYTNERVLVNKIGYRTGEIQRFDVVICRYPGSNEYYVKRVIGMPGDVIKIDRGTVYVNDHELDEKYVVFSDTTSMIETTVQDGYYMVFGDNRADSTDSRSIGAISEDAIVGRVVAVTWPMSKISKIKRIDEDAVMLEIAAPTPTPYVEEMNTEEPEEEMEGAGEDTQDTTEEGAGEDQAG